MKYEILIGTCAIWVNADTGECIGRFGRFGIDIHRRVEDQHLGQCLYCTHARVTAYDWVQFKVGMRMFHGVDLSRVDMPRFVA